MVQPVTGRRREGRAGKKSQSKDFSTIDPYKMEKFSKKKIWRF
jgi:hypothetical protein